MKHAITDSAGAVTKFLDDVNHPVLPPGTVELSDAQYERWIADTDAWRWRGGDLVAAPPAGLPTVLPTLVAGLRIACAQHLSEGFGSSALGAPHHYPSGEVDQRNLALAATLAMTPGAPGDWSTPLWCADASGGWNLAPHSAEQVRHVASDWLAYRTAAQTRLTTMVAQASTASTVAAAEAVTW